MWKLLLLLLLVSAVSSGPPCPDGSIFSSELNSCYKVVKEPQAYSAAEQNCINEGGHLISIQSEDENAFIAALLHSSNDVGGLYYWIGASEPPTNYTKWASGQNSLNGCTALTPFGGLWAKVDCAFTAPYICKMEPIPCPECPSCPPPHSYCDSEWTYLQESDSCYRGFFDANWDKANNTCIQHNASLASIHSDNENKFIYDLVTMGKDGNTGDSDMTWFGLHRSPPGTDNFVYTDGTTFDPALFNKWAPNGEPNNLNENCVQLTSDKRIVEKDGHTYNFTMLWNDAYCDKQHRRFVCKKPAFHG